MRSRTHYHNQRWSNVFLHNSANKNKKRDSLTTARPWFFQSPFSDGYVLHTGMEREPSTNPPDPLEYQTKM
jgi:hypothetical protein